MSAEWRALLKGKRYVIEGDAVKVLLPNDRSQQVMIESHRSGTALRLWSVVLSKSRTDQLAEGQPDQYAWERNRFSDIVGFCVDSRGRFIGESWVPIAGLSHAVFQLHLDELARVCDWHELRLSDDDLY